MERARAVERRVSADLRRIERGIGTDLERLRLEAGVSKSAVARGAGVDRTFYGRIEAGLAHASIETLVAIGVALGADVSVRLYAGSGPRLVDRHQAVMLEALLRATGAMWRPHLEVPVWRPVRGVIDAVFERRTGSELVIAELQSTVTRLEQVVRWANEKAEAIASSSLVGTGPTPETRRLLVIRSTEANRAVARRFASTLRAAYPGRSVDAVSSLADGTPFPEAAIVWIRIERGVATVLERPPRGVEAGR